MVRIEAKDLHFKELNEKIRACNSEMTIADCLGQSFICAGMREKKVEIHGTPGNALGAYLGEGSHITIRGNAQDAVGDTMNDGTMVIHGNAGDALGYAMRGGQIFVKGHVGYRAGVHMKEYKEKRPVLVIGGQAGSFLGEYQAGGLIIILGLEGDDAIPISNFTGTGMHGGKIFIRTKAKTLPAVGQDVITSVADEKDMAEITPYIEQYGKYFDLDVTKVARSSFLVLSPNAKNPYKQMYTYN